MGLANLFFFQNIVYKSGTETLARELAVAKQELNNQRQEVKNIEMEYDQKEYQLFNQPTTSPEMPLDDIYIEEWINSPTEAIKPLEPIISIPCVAYIDGECCIDIINLGEGDNCITN